MRPTLIIQLFILCCFNPSAWAKKVALIVKNTVFTDKGWADEFKEINRSDTAIAKLLSRHGFLKENILIHNDLTAQEFRGRFQEFVSTKVGRGDIVVVSLIPDKSSDEVPFVKGTYDQVFICKDTPSNLSKEHILIHGRRYPVGFFKPYVQRDSMDFHPRAIIDDEFSILHRSVLEKVGGDGQYFLLADYCHSDKSAKGNGNATAHRIGDGKDYTDFIGEKSDSAPKLPPFLVLAATNTMISVGGGGVNISYFVRALIRSMDRDSYFPPTYKSLYDRFRIDIKEIAGSNRGKSIFLNNGGPQLNPNIPGDENALVFGGDLHTTGTISKVIRVIYKKLNLKGQKSQESNSAIFQIRNAYTYETGLYVELFLKGGQKMLAEGFVTRTDEDEIEVELLNEYKPATTGDYEVRRSKRYERAMLALKKAKNPLDVKYVLRELHNPGFRVNIKSCVNDTNQCVPIKMNTLDFNDKVIVKVTPWEQARSYTILDVTAKNGLQHCYRKESKSNIPVGFRNKHELFTSKITEPTGKAALWVLVSDQSMEPRDYDTHDALFKDCLLGKTLFAENKARTWELLRHVKYFEEINYNVIRERKR
jgi:hypothetical protein